MSSATMNLSDAGRRPLALKMRPDLVVQPAPLGDRARWRLKDPVSLQYFELSEQEFAILQWLDGRSSLAEIKQRFERRFAPLQLSLSRLHSYLAQLHLEGLVLAVVPGQGTVLLERARLTAAAEWTSKSLSLLAIRFRGVDPDRFLNRLYPAVRWIFSPVFLGAAALVILAALMLALAQFDQFQSQLPDLPTFLTPSNVAWMVASLALIKLFHELGHALTCKHFGGRCHEMGIMLLVFTPCLYCDVSDAWLMPGRGPRLAISAAGVFVELFLAAIATFLWWQTEPGLLNSLCLNVMVVASVGTLLINGNPLLRYDGYYLLSDWLEEPNLHQRSQSVLGRLALRYLLGIESAPVPGISPGRRAILLTYGILSSAYRCFILVAILWFCYSFLDQRGFAPLGDVLTVLTVGGVLYPTFSTVASIAKSPAQRSRVRPRVLWTAILTGGVCLLLALFVPLPQRVAAELVVEPAAAQAVYIPAPGRLVFAAAPGTIVRQGETIGKLQNTDLLREIEKLHGEHERLSIRLGNLESRRADDPQAAASIPATREALSAAEKQLRQRQKDARRLELAAPCDGIVLPPPEVTLPEGETKQLHAWQETPLSPRNLGTWLEIGALFCQVSSTPTYEAVALLRQDDIDLVRRGHRVRFVLEQYPDRVFHGAVSEISATALESVPRELVGRVPIRPTAYDQLHPAEPMYQVRLVPDDPGTSLLIRTRGRAKILIDPIPLGTWLSRTLRQAFLFRR